MMSPHEAGRYFLDLDTRSLSYGLTSATTANRGSWPANHCRIERLGNSASIFFHATSEAMVAL